MVSSTCIKYANLRELCVNFKFQDFNIFVLYHYVLYYCFCVIFICFICEYLRIYKYIYLFIYYFLCCLFEIIFVNKYICSPRCNFKIRENLLQLKR